MKILLIISSLFLSSYAYATGIDIPKTFVYLLISGYLIIPVIVTLLITIKSKLNRSKKHTLVGSILVSMILPFILTSLNFKGIGFDFFLFFFIPTVVSTLWLMYWLFASCKKS